MKEYKRLSKILSKDYKTTINVVEEYGFLNVGITIDNTKSIGISKVNLMNDINTYLKSKYFLLSFVLFRDELCLVLEED
jgi:hypothetical protein